MRAPSFSRFEATYALPGGFENKIADKIANLTLAEAKAQLAEDLALNKEVLILRGKKELGHVIFKASGITDFQVR